MSLKVNDQIGTKCKRHVMNNSCDIFCNNSV